MSKLTLQEISNITGAEQAAISKINANSDAIETALENTLSRDGTTPNQMEADLDLNSYDILNLPEATDLTSPVRLNEVNVLDDRIDDLEASFGLINASVGAAAASASNAATSASNAATSETNASASEAAAQAAQAAAEAALDQFDDTYLGAKASEPSLDNDGNALTTGDLYFNTTDNTFYVYTGSVWEAATTGVSSFEARTGAVTSQAGDYTASEITNVPAGSLAAVTVQAALDELDAEKQPLDSDLTAIAALNTAAYGRSVLETTSEADFKSLVNLEIGTDVQAWDTQLDDLSGLAVTNGNFIVGDGLNWVAESGATARASLGLGSISTQNSTNVSITGGSVTGITDLAIADGGTGASTSSVARSNLGLVIGTDVQAWDTQLDDISGLAVTDGNFIVGDGLNWIAESGATVRTSLGLGTGDSPQFTAINIGHASDTTVARSSAGDITVEGNLLYRAGGTDVPLADGGTGTSLSDPGVDRVMAWDDTAGVVKFMPLADFNTEGSPASGDFILGYTAEGALVNISWDDLPGASSGITTGKAIAMAMVFG